MFYIDQTEKSISTEKRFEPRNKWVGMHLRQKSRDGNGKVGGGGGGTDFL